MQIVPAAVRKILSKRKTEQAMWRSFLLFQEGKVWATDGHRIHAMKHEHGPDPFVASLDGKIQDRNLFPPLEAAIPSDKGEWIHIPRPQLTREIKALYDQHQSKETREAREVAREAWVAVGEKRIRENKIRESDEEKRLREEYLRLGPYAEIPGIGGGVFFDTKYLQDAMGLFTKATEVSIRIPDDRSSPVRMEGDNGSTAVIMPVRRW